MTKTAKPFDPFGDFEDRGYLRNRDGLKILDDIRTIEHFVFLDNLSAAGKFLKSKPEITYQHFLKVHEILFSDFYPSWAGQDRTITAPNLAIKKANAEFCPPYMCERAITEGLRMGNDKELIKRSPGSVMGYFAFGHPFLDGNGRTMMLVHHELCTRAGFSIDWSQSDKNEYLRLLTLEIDSPGNGALDKYLLNFASPKINLDQFIDRVSQVKGLDGSEVDLDEDSVIVGVYSADELKAGYEAANILTTQK